MPGLYEESVQRFDNLRAEGRLFYEETEPENVRPENSQMNLQFRLVEHFTKKPMPGHDDETEGQAGGKPDPFGKPDPRFVVGETSKHLVQLNMFCAMRPQLILHPKEYAPQKDALDEDDFEAAFEVLRRLKDEDHGESRETKKDQGGGRFLVFYNCCPESGSSQPYKHMQLIPQPEDFDLFPETYLSSLISCREKNGEEVSDLTQEPVSAPEIPILHYIIALNTTSTTSTSGSNTASETSKGYKTLLSKLPKHPTYPLIPHNVIFTSDWLCIIPRRKGGVEKTFANSLGMLGLIWVSTPEDRRSWDEFGLVDLLVELGYPAHS